VSIKDEPRAFCRDVLDPEQPHMFKTAVVLLIVMASTAYVDLNTGNNAVHGFPVITAHPKADTVTLGAPATFSVTADGNPTFQWQLNGTAVSGGTNSTLTLTNVQAANAGYVPSYGEDQHTLEASDLFRELFETDCDVYFVFNGTAIGFEQFAEQIAMSTSCSTAPQRIHWRLHRSASQITL
jgi:hypothetical protein